ncbi:MAG: Lrp/AsnC family transcriptional regulator [Alphaproteobacteria bacterium]|uniref:Lrp/AsnC family transcriptional regulator n=1 Tax=Hyphomonas sp. TaxID=87 RepID=UPI001E1956FA|nr:Lrp/AsnC family transcriptional regulator [Alphaproteobacteria bacterium]MBU2085136.1 Lrp/AsnC family transcriptional regulator [Alphaproteobacteria bacterium]MBU2142066.1 Lrp/AsnC family transcriptional regulator [Alphaproteobacteria bacterium]MBU2196958.1 Lrp/AsnC family transcriptional regulator [Alphaproteobacteria bacterium]
MKKIAKLDEIDRRILNSLQLDASLSIQEVADKVGLSTNPCWRRIKRLEDEGIILKRVALLDAQAVGLGITVFVSVRTENHSKAWLDVFARSVDKIPEIIECHRLTGKDDYLLKLQIGSIEHYDIVYKRFVELVPNLVDVSSTFSMETVKFSTSLTLPVS